MDIRRAKADQWGEAASMALLLWPSHPKEDLEQEFQALLQNPDAAVFFAYVGTYWRDLPNAACEGIMWRVPPLLRLGIWKGFLC